MSSFLSFTDAEKYRKDIDGLRAIAVLSVIIFHFGFLPSGFLGVDVFFVISGFLITNIIYQGILKGTFSIADFYLRRTRRIIPLVSFICIVSLLIGMVVMLPDELENLAQSVIATNFFSNNVLAMVTTKNYWDVVNEFKPLMHTWSLGIEEQYYFLYPFMFLFLGKRIKWILPVLIGLTILSMVLFFSPFPEYQKFYFLPFRFFELSVGGIAAILLRKRLLKHNLSFVLLIALIVLLVVDFSSIPETIPLFLTIMVTCALLASANRNSKLTTLFLENKTAIFIGKISFSLYMWHQLILAFGRYFVFEEMVFGDYALVFILTVLLSILTYYFVETPFRTKSRVSTKTLLWTVSLAFVLTTGVSFYIYLNAGVLRDVPELDIVAGNAERNMHAKYNDRVYKMDQDFADDGRVKILVVGNSFARDWVNVLLESEYADFLDISYIYRPENYPEKVAARAKGAAYVFHSPYKREALQKMSINDQLSFCVGVKNFGINNGYYYNYRGDDFCEQRTHMDKKVYALHSRLKERWKGNYIDFMDLVMDQNEKVPVFSPSCKFISQDTRHFTRAGAEYFAALFSEEGQFLDSHFGSLKSSNSLAYNGRK